MSPDCPLLSRVGARLLMGGLWVTPEGGYDVMPRIVICKLHGHRDTAHLACASCMHTSVCLLIETMCYHTGRKGSCLLLP